MYRRMEKENENVGMICGDENVGLIHQKQKTSSCSANEPTNGERYSREQYYGREQFERENRDLGKIVERWMLQTVSFIVKQSLCSIQMDTHMCACVCVCVWCYYIPD